MAAARGVLQRNVPLLYTASHACLLHPDVAAYKANRDLIYKQLTQAVTGISNAAQATTSEDANLGQQSSAGELEDALNRFDVSTYNYFQINMVMKVKKFHLDNTAHLQIFVAYL